MALWVSYILEEMSKLSNRDERIELLSQDGDA